MEFNPIRQVPIRSDHLMPEVPDSGGEEDDPVLVAAVDGVLVPQGASGVDDGLDARLAGQLHGVVPREGEEGVRGKDRALQQSARRDEKRSERA